VTVLPGCSDTGVFMEGDPWNGRRAPAAILEVAKVWPPIAREERMVHCCTILDDDWRMVRTHPITYLYYRQPYADLSHGSVLDILEARGQRPRAESISNTGAVALEGPTTGPIA